MKRKKLCVFLAVAIVVAIGVVIFGDRFYTHEKTEGLTQIGPKVDVLVIAEPNQSSDELTNKFEDGDIDLLMWLDETPEGKQAYAFNTLESLVRLEKNNLGYLDSDEPTLKGLSVARYDASQGTLYYTQINVAHISALEVNRNYLIGEILSDPQNYKVAAGVVI